MNITRKETWHEDLQTYWKTLVTAQFQWGDLDCCMFAANSVRAMTGVDMAKGFRGKYEDGPSAFKALQDFAGGGVVTTMEKLAADYGLEEIKPVKAQRGDIVLLPPEMCGGDTRFDGALGMCAGLVSLFMSDEGVKATSTIPTPGAPGITRAWRIKVARA